MPVFEDYHRTIIGYHGTRSDIARGIVSHERDFHPSSNDDDWLGHGIYFWEYAPQRAWSWAARRYGHDDVAVLGAMIRLGSCLDLLEPANAEQVRTYYRKRQEAEAAGNRLPKNYLAKKRLDCAVFEYTAGMFEAEGEPLDTIPGVYVPTSSKQRLVGAELAVPRSTHPVVRTQSAELFWAHGC